jgi:hypothetical protein
MTSLPISRLQIEVVQVAGEVPGNISIVKRPSSRSQHSPVTTACLASRRGQVAYDAVIVENVDRIARLEAILNGYIDCPTALTPGAGSLRASLLTKNERGLFIN